jgi:non-ribosomal peptide synthase protein (TIGR01720 family)
VSWPLLVADLGTAYRQAQAGQPIALPGRTSSYAAWTARLAELAESAEVASEARSWAEVAAAVQPLPRDHDGRNRVALTAEVAAGLEPAQAAPLLQEVPGAAGLQVNEVLLAGLGLTLGRWAGTGQVVVDVEGHGRQDVGGGIDVTRTAGWFTSVFPVLLDGGGNPGDALAAVKERLRALPRGGLGYGLLRHLRDRNPGARAELVFNYLGQRGTVRRAAGEDAGLRWLDRSAGEPVARSGERDYLIEVNCWAGDHGLEVVWSYSRDVHDEATITALAQSYLRTLKRLIAYCTRPGTSRLTPSDFPLAGLSQQTLDALQERFKSAGTTDSGGGS